MHRFVLGFVAVLSFALSTSTAQAVGLDVVTTLTSGNGQLTFSAFSATATGSVRSNLALYDVSALADGLAITGPFSAADGQAGDLILNFTVTSTQAITGAALLFNGAAAGTGSNASVTETFGAPLADEQLLVFATGAGGLDLSDTETLAASTTFRVTKDIQVASTTPGGIAVISRIEQRFTAPEPAAMLLIGTAFVGLAVARKRLA